MAQTTRGISYPTSGDNIAPLETHFHSMATSIDGAIDDVVTEVGKSPIAGIQSFTGPASTGATVDVSVTFPTSFTVAPTVVLSVEGSGTMSPYFAYILGTPSISGFTARVYRVAGSTAETNLYIHWMAK